MSDGAQQANAESGPAVFRAKRSAPWFFGLCVVFFIVGAAAFLWDMLSPAGATTGTFGGSRTGQGLAALFMLAMTAGSAWMMLHCLRHELVISSEHIIEVGAFRRTVLDVTDLQEIRVNTRGYLVTLRSSTGCVRLGFNASGIYSRATARAIVAALLRIAPERSRADLDDLAQRLARRR